MSKTAPSSKGSVSIHFDNTSPESSAEADVFVIDRAGLECFGRFVDLQDAGDRESFANEACKALGDPEIKADDIGQQLFDVCQAVLKGKPFPASVVLADPKYDPAAYRPVTMSGLEIVNRLAREGWIGKLPHPLWFVLFLYANHANKEGVSFLKPSTIERLTNTSLRNVQKSIHELSRLSLLETVIQGGGRSRQSHRRVTLPDPATFTYVKLRRRATVKRANTTANLSVVSQKHTTAHGDVVNGQNYGAA